MKELECSRAFVHSTVVNLRLRCWSWKENITVCYTLFNWRGKKCLALLPLAGTKYTLWINYLIIRVSGPPFRKRITSSFHSILPYLENDRNGTESTESSLNSPSEFRPVNHRHPGHHTHIYLINFYIFCSHCTKNDNGLPFTRAERIMSMKK